ncbi:transcription termination factor MTERF5, chloroplastic-like [Pistacia vera]|uniref:transcription termination factor MTERF5, chloroplastic-like n=1 Tax=Pistacia vera TaxID=55513 RepID=UPI001262DA6C|nr:transcription termination factor MTERF5, chloroplastic-like [Pistacia vera]
MLKMEMKALCANRLSNFSSLFRGTLCITRTRLTFPENLLGQAKLAFSSGNESFNTTVVPPTLLAAEKEEAKSVLSLFLKKQGLSKVAAAKTITKSDLFINHLVSRLHSVHKSRYLVGKELTTLEIRDTLIPYIESLLVEPGNSVVNLVENFPIIPVKDKPAASVSQHPSTPDSKKPKGQRAVSRMIEVGAVGDLQPHFLYLLELGMDLEQIKLATSRCPSFAYYCLEGRIKPLVEFLLDLGVAKSEIPKILVQRPHLCGHSISGKIIPIMLYLEDMGVDKKQWAKVILRSPCLLSHSRQKLQAVVNFLNEVGLSGDSIGKALTRFPKMVSCSVEDNLMPVNKFFYEKGFSVEEMKSMVSTFPSVYSYSLTESLVPKWEFFLTTGYSKLALVKFPQYFSYSLEQRIRPRFALVKELGVKIGLNRMLAVSFCDFEKVLEISRKNMLADELSSCPKSK